MILQAYPAQNSFITCPEYYAGFVGGRGAGKSKGAALRLLYWATRTPALYGMYAPTYPLLQDTIMRCFVEVCPREWIRAHNKADNTIALANGSEILCRSLDDPERARGPSLAGAVVDEASLCAKEAYDILIGCLRYKGKQGWLACSFTPRGPAHWTAEVFNTPGRANTACFHARTKENPFAPPDFYETLLAQYTSKFAMQELEGRFVSLAGALMQRDWFRISSDVNGAPYEGCLRYWDMAASEPEENKDPDYTAGALVALRAGVWYILDVQRFRHSPMTTEELIRATAERDGVDVPIRMEREGGASGKIAIDHYARHVLVGYSFDEDVPGKSKALRAQPLAAAAERRNVVLKYADWNKAFLDEVESFPSEGVHDDMVDSVAGAINCLASRLGYRAGYRPTDVSVPPPVRIEECKETAEQRQARIMATESAWVR